MEYYQIKNHFVKLTTTLELQSLINMLYSQHVLSCYDYENLTGKSRTDKNIAFLLNIEMYGALTYFSQWLKTMHPDLFDLACKGDIPKTQAKTSRLSKDILRKNISVLRKCLNVRLIAPYLYQESMMTSDTLESIVLQPLRCEQFHIMQGLIDKKIFLLPT